MPKIKKIISEKEKIVEEKEKDFFVATGKRKSAVAQVKLKLKSKDKILVNQKDYQKYFPFFTWQKIILDPLKVLKLQNVEILVKVKGGGLQAQAESIRLGISRALVKANPEWRKILKPLGFLKRDSRIKERKKPGLKRARRAPQWQKR
ncbi:MAG: 30S ribosomal protein S9 [Patescibacteria group bacterium]|nr:30S ribosomal protein S9 [Patescibacteria group bacterium]